MRLFYVLLATIVLAITWSAAHAETTNLEPMTCYQTRVCINVPNTAGLQIDYISSSTQYGRLVISINGDIYDSGLYAYPDLSNFTLYDAIGRILTGSVSITTVRATKCVQSGRVCVFPTTVKLNGGTLVMP